jgi:hypothetical protein
LSQPLGFQLEINFPDQSPHKIPLGSKLSLGGSDKSELCIEDYGLSPLHLSFRVHNNLLSLHNLGGKNSTHLGDQQLNHGKMYLLNIGDIIKVGDIEIKICESESAPVAAEETTPDQPSEVDPQDKTAPGFSFDKMTDEQIEEAENDVDDEEGYYEEDAEFEEESSPGFFQRLKNKFKKKKPQDEDEEEFILEEDYEDEDLEEESEDEQDIDELLDDEEEGEEQPSQTLVMRLKNKLLKGKKKDPRELNIKKSAAKVVKVQPPGPFIRLFSLICNIALSVTLVFEVFPMFDLAKKIAPWYAKLDPVFAKVPYSHYISQDIFTVILTFIALDLVFALLLGVNLSQFILGIKSERGLVLSRIQALFRSLISYVTTPLIILDAPCVVGKRTLKEFLTASQLTSRSKVYSILAGLLFIPLLALSPFYVPIALNMDSLKAINVSESRTVKVKKDDRVKSVWPTDILKVKFFGNWDKNFHIAANIKTSNKSSVTIYDLDNKFYNSEIAYKSNADLLESITSYKKLNPIFKFDSPSLSDLKSVKGKVKLSSSHLTEYKALAEMALKLNTQTLLDAFLVHGPFFKDVFKLKKDLISLLKLNDRSNVEIYSTKKKLVFISENKTRKNQSLTILLIDESGDMKLYESKAKTLHSKLHKKSVSLFFQNAKLKKDSDTPNSWDWTKLSNTLMEVEKSKRDITDLEIAAIYDSYFDTASKIMSSGSDSKPLKHQSSWFSANINQTALYLEDLLEFKSHMGISELKDSLLKLSSALKENKVDFFSLEK